MCYFGCLDFVVEMVVVFVLVFIVFKDNREYFKKFVYGVKMVYQFGRIRRGRYSVGIVELVKFYNLSMYWDEFIWGGVWLYYVIGNVIYFDLIIKLIMVKYVGVFWGGFYYGVFSWDNKFVGVQVSL